jgi:hypothetical protein
VKLKGVTKKGLNYPTGLRAEKKLGMEMSISENW